MRLLLNPLRRSAPLRHCPLSFGGAARRAVAELIAAARHSRRLLLPALPISPLLGLVPSPSYPLTSVSSVSLF